MPFRFLFTLHGITMTESLSPTRYSQNISICDEGKEKEITCHTKVCAVVFYKATAVSQWPAVLLVQNTLDLISLSWDKVQLCSAIIHRKFTGIHRMYCEKGKIQKWMNGTQTLCPDTYRLIEWTIYFLNIWVNICVTDIWDTISAKHIKGSQFYLLFPLSGDLYLTGNRVTIRMKKKIRSAFPV